MKSGNRLLVIDGLIAVALVAAMAVSVFGVGPVAFENPGFEQGDQGWGTWGDGDLREAYHAVSPKDGASMLRLWKRSGWYQDMPVGKGDRFLVSACVSSASKDAMHGDAYGEVKVEWRNKAEGDNETGAPVSLKFDLVGKQEVTVLADQWKRIDLPEIKAPPGATHARVLLTIWCTDEKGGGCALFDQVSIVALPAMP